MKASLKKGVLTNYGAVKMRTVSGRINNTCSAWMWTQ